MRELILKLLLRRVNTRINELRYDSILPKEPLGKRSLQFFRSFIDCKVTCLKKITQRELNEQ